MEGNQQAAYGRLTGSQRVSQCFQSLLPLLVISVVLLLVSGGDVVSGLCLPWDCPDHSSPH